MEKEQKYPLGLALSGGGARGFAHLGVFQALEERNMKPDIIVGTSAGALAGVLYADGHPPQEIASFFQHKDFRDFAAFSIPNAGLFKNHKFQSFLKKYIRTKNLEDLAIPLKITATDFENGTFKTFDKGPIIPIVLASCSYPIVFTPVIIDGVHYVDGGLFKNFPVSEIRRECEKVIGINVSPVTSMEYKNSLLHVIERSFHYISASNSIVDASLCDILIEVDNASKFSTFSLDHIDEIYTIGYEKANKVLDRNNIVASVEK